jgi:hypothetical protein
MAWQKKRGKHLRCNFIRLPYNGSLFCFPQPALKNLFATYKFVVAEFKVCYIFGLCDILYY